MEFIIDTLVFIIGAVVVLATLDTHKSEEERRKNRLEGLQSKKW